MNNSVYEEKFKLRINDYDNRDHIYLGAIMDLFQDVAGSHADLLHIGYDDLIKNDLIWMILRNKVEIYNTKPKSDYIIVKTWPHVPGRVDMDRDYVIYSEDGELIAKGCSKWVICSYTTRKLIRAKDFNYHIDDFCENVNFDEPFDKVIFDDEYGNFKMGEIKTTFLDVDHNGHINNTKYLNYIFICVEEIQNKEIKKFQIDYLHELTKNSIVTIKYYQIGKTIFVKGISCNQDCFVAKIEME